MLPFRFLSHFLVSLHDIMQFLVKIVFNYLKLVFTKSLMCSLKRKSFKTSKIKKAEQRLHYISFFQRRTILHIVFCAKNPHMFKFLFTYEESAFGVIYTQALQKNNLLYRETASRTGDSTPHDSKHPNPRRIHAGNVVVKSVQPKIVWSVASSYHGCRYRQKIPLLSIPLRKFGNEHWIAVPFSSVVSFLLVMACIALRNVRGMITWSYLACAVCTCYWTDIGIH